MRAPARIKTPTLTHDQATRAAIAWLLERRCWVAFDEAVWEPWRVDALGLGRPGIVAIEVKVSRKDFLDDFAAGDYTAKSVARWTEKAKLHEKVLARLKKALNKALKSAGLPDFDAITSGASARENLEHWRSMNKLPEHAAYWEGFSFWQRLVRAGNSAASRGSKANDLLTAGVAERHWIAAPKGLVAPSEIPMGWGLLEIASKSQCHAAVQAPHHRLRDLATVWRKWLQRCAARCSHQVRDQQRAIEKLKGELQSLNDRVLRVAM